MTIDEVKKDLNDIRIFNSRKDFHAYINPDLRRRMQDKVDLYTSVVKQAPFDLQALFDEIYLKSNSQIAFCVNFGYCEKSITRKKRDLEIFFKKNIH